MWPCNESIKKPGLGLYSRPLVKVGGSEIEKGKRHVRSATALSDASSPLFQVSAGIMVRKKFESE